MCSLYEQQLKTLNPQVRNITYDISDLFAFMEQLSELSCLVCARCASFTPALCQLHIARSCARFNQQMNAYLSRGKDWMKQQVFQHLKKDAQGVESKVG